MTTTRPSASESIRAQMELRELVYDIVYARVLVAVDGEGDRGRDRPLRLALRRALGQLAADESERRRIASEALEAAWGRLASELGIEPAESARAVA